MDYQIVIGLEVHIQLLTRSKLFCGCSTKFGLPPNSATCPVCSGMPGVLPVINRQAFELALRAALALNCRIAPFTKWDRKNYYYPDLPKNYQISQYDLPFSRDGWLELPAATPLAPAGKAEKATGSPKRIGIIRVHLEEDAGKMLHDEQGGGLDSLVDLNRTGTPLLEIVTKPDISAPEEAKAFLEEIRLLMRELEVSDCEMQEGSLRCDANINLHVPQSDRSYAATPIVEVKNLNSFRAVERAMKYEAQRQWEAFQSTGKKLGEEPKATAGWNDAKGVTIMQRRKEEASDYRYFPEPDLVPAVVDQKWIDHLKASLGELPAAQRTRLREQYGLSPYDAGVIAQQGRRFVAYFEEVAERSGDAKEASNWLTNQVLQTLNDRKIGISSFSLTAAALADLIRERKITGLNAQRAREVYARMLETGAAAGKAIADLGFKVISDEGELVAMVRRAIAANP